MMKRIVPFAALVVLALCLPSCVDGKFSPTKTAAMIDAVSAPACAMLGVFVGDKVVGTVCDDAVDLIQAVLYRLDLDPAKMPAPTATDYVPLKEGDRVIGFVCSSVAPALKAGLAAEEQQ